MNMDFVEESDAWLNDELAACVFRDVRIKEVLINLNFNEFMSVSY